MALKIKRRKKNSNSAVDPRHLSGRDRTWRDDYSERNDSKVRRNMMAIIAFLIVIVVILVIAAINASMPRTQDTTEIEASDTFAVTQAEQDEMEQATRLFAQGFLRYTYASDQDTSLQGKNDMLSTMATGTDAYSTIESLDQRNPIIDSANLTPVTTDPVMQNPTQVYADDLVWECDAAALDESQQTSTGQQGAFADRGWHIRLTFNDADDSDSDSTAYMVTSATITRN